MLRRLFTRYAWCCRGFRHLHESRYGRTLFLFVRPPTSQRPHHTFWLATRAVAHADLARLPAAIAPASVPVTISTSLAIRFCPFCGTNLSRFYATHAASLVDGLIWREFESPTIREPEK